MFTKYITTKLQKRDKTRELTDCKGLISAHMHAFHLHFTNFSPEFVHFKHVQVKV